MAEENSGFNVEFLTQPPFNVSCTICLLTMKDPVQIIPCSHQFCKDCTTHHISSSSYTHCPVCKGEIENWFPDGAMKRMILDLHIKCSNHEKGCSDTFELRFLEEHSLTCVYEEVQCSLEDCEVKVQRQYIHDHLEECPKRSVHCEHCEENYYACDKQVHEERCTQFPVLCENECGVTIAREEMANHLEDVCLKEIRQCKYLDIIGCKNQGTLPELSEHMKKQMDQHFTLAVDEIKELKNTKTNIFSQVENLKNDIKSSQILELERKCNLLWKIALKTTLRNGVTVEVKDFAAQVKTVEEHGKPINFWSEKFYCFEGYLAKLLVKITKIDEIVYSSVYFTLFKGPSDDNLEWPFAGKIVFTCRGEDNIEPRILDLSTSTQTAETIEESFKKPVSENFGRGFSKFLGDNCNMLDYAIEDTLKIEVKVSKEQQDAEVATSKQ